MNRLVISYVPLFYPERAGATLEGKDIGEQIQSILQGREELGQARFAMWFQNAEDGIDCAIGLHRAKEICEHLKTWSDEQPVRKFKLQVRTSAEDQGYMLALMPDLAKSVERWEINYQLQVGFPPAKTTSAQVIFIPISFCAKASPMFPFVDQVAGRRVRVSFVDVERAEKFVELSQKAQAPAREFMHEVATFVCEKNDQLFPE